MHEEAEKTGVLRGLPRLTPRLAAVAELVRPGGVVADIGTDHAYLPVFLVKSGRSPRAFACDVKKGPLERAEKTIGAYRAAENIKMIQCDGLDGVSYADDVVIAGMGGELIANILARCAFIKNPGVALVLQPMTAVPQLRSFLCLSGFEITRETVARENLKLYVIMTAVYTGNTFKPDELFCLTGLLPKEGGAGAAAYLSREARRLRKIASGLRASSDRGGESLKYDRLAGEIERLAENAERRNPAWKGKTL